MKSLLILSIFFSSLFASQQVKAEEARVLRDFPVLVEVLDFVNEASYDLDSYFKVEELQDFPFDGMACKRINSKELKKFIKDEFKKVSNFYPDEGIPFSKALKELDHYLGSSDYLKCERVENKDKYQIVSQYFQTIDDVSPILVVEFEKRI